MTNSLTFLDADAGAGAKLVSTATGLRDVSLHTEAAFPKDKTEDMATLLAMLYALLGFSIVVSLFGMINTMVLSVFERTREIGMLRTVGLTRRQTRRMIRHESVITAMIGATLGVGLGLLLAVLATVATPDLHGRSRSRGRRWPASRWSPPWPASARRSCRPAAHRA